MVTDPIADLITRIRNAGKAGKDSVLVPYSKLKEAIAVVLVAEGYIKSASKKKTSPILELVLNYHNGESKIKKIERVSKSSRRIYRGFADIHLTKGGFDKTIYSTPKGILVDRQAIREKVGGEALFRIW